MIIDGFLGDRLYSVVLDEDEYTLFSELEELREFAKKSIREAKKIYKTIAGKFNKNGIAGLTGADIQSVGRLGTDIWKTGTRELTGGVKKVEGPGGILTSFAKHRGTGMKRLQRALANFNRSITRPIQATGALESSQQYRNRIIEQGLATEAASKRYLDRVDAIEAFNKRGIIV